METVMFGGQFQQSLVATSHNGFATVRETKCTLEHCYDKTMENKNGLASRMLFSELHKTLVNKVYFVGFRGAIALFAPLDLPWAKEGNCPVVCVFPHFWMIRLR